MPIGSLQAVLAVALAAFATALAHAQASTTLVNNIGETANTESEVIHYRGFTTGNHEHGYVLDTVEIRCVNASPNVAYLTLRNNRKTAVGVFPVGNPIVLTGPSAFVAGINEFNVP